MLFTPEFYQQLQHLKIKTRRSFLGSRQGTHLSIRHGHGMEFADHRNYSPGDDYRHIDWGIYGRTDKLYIKEFREEQELSVSILLDTSASMGLPKSEEKFIRAKELSLALSYIALTDGHSVNICFLGERRTPAYSGPASITKIQKEVEAVSPRGEIDFKKEILASVARLKLPGKCFVVSDFLMHSTEIASSLDVLRAKNYEIVLLHILGSSELRLPAISEPFVKDAETGEELEISADGKTRAAYARALAEHVQFIEEYALKSGITYLLIPAEQTIREILFKRLPQLGVIQ